MLVGEEDSRGRRIHIDRHVVRAEAKPGEMHLKAGRICISISFPLDRPMTPQQKQVDLNKARGEPSFQAQQHRREQDSALPCIKDYFFTPQDCILITAAVPFSISPSNLILLFLVCAFPPTARHIALIMPQTGNQTSLYNRLVIAFVALGGTVSLRPLSSFLLEPFVL